MSICRSRRLHLLFLVLILFTCPCLAFGVYPAEDGHIFTQIIYVESNYFARSSVNSPLKSFEISIRERMAGIYALDEKIEKLWNEAAARPI